MRRLLAVSTSLLVLGTGALVAASPAGAASDTSTPLPITSYADMLVDEAHGHVFLTPGGGGSTVTVTDLTGANPTTLSGITGATGLATDGTTVYVATADGIDAIDPAEQVTQPYRGLDCPRDVAVDSGRLWFSHGCAGEQGVVGSIVLSSGAVTLDATGTAWPNPPDLAAAAGVLAAGDGGAPSQLRTFTVSSGSAVARSNASDANVCSGLVALTVTPDGAGVGVACGSPDHVSLLTSSDLTTVSSSYGGANGTPVGAALTADGGFLATSFTGTSTNNVVVYPVGSPTTARAQYSLGPGVLPADGLRFGGSGDLYAVVPTNTAQTAFALDVAHGSELYAATVTVHAPTSAPRARPLAVSGALTSSADAPVSAPQTLHVARTDLSGTAALPDVTTAADGTFTLADTPTVGGPVVYTVTWDGDGAHRPASGHTTVQVSRVATTVTITTNAARYAYRARAYVTAHLGTTFNSRTVSIYATPYRGTRVLLRATRVNRHGNAFASYVVSRRTTFAVVFAGDYRRAPGSAARTVLVRAHVAEQFENYYASAHGYRLYHRAQNPTLAAQLFPAQWGVCLYFRAQRLYGGAWHTVALSSCYRTDPAGQQAAALYNNHVVGQPYRLRAEWHGSRTAAASVGAWLYMKFTR